jgi:hypothetical protein
MDIVHDVWTLSIIHGHFLINLYKKNLNFLVGLAPINQVLLENIKVFHKFTPKKRGPRAKIISNDV